ncbi:hypothetical protein E2493_05075 [Sphingomonas parva]|uniref:DUF1311 domain-containing protein n=1 Tax=Sphingomonas parva TaxID=2555898 RepID=A0A4Y8ZT81_9SPHN|nr:hypothetical protein [Sphingomonas parva]TFI59221.1 hypothetical protein E2493_05075 [Sphingomonas parva]
MLAWRQLRGAARAVGAACAAVLLSTSANAAPPSKPLPTKQQLKACPAFKDIDFRKIYADYDSGRTEWRQQLEARHAATRGPYGPFQPPADAALTLRIWAGGSETQEVRTDTSSVVWKGADGAWRVDRVDHATTRPPPPPPPPPAGWDGKTPYFQRSPDEEARLVRDHIVGILDPQRAAGIEQTLRDPCFLLQPDSMPFVVPVKKGREPLSPCWGIIGGTLEMRWADGRRRDVTELCGNFYARGIINAVMYARPLAEDAQTTAACDPLRSAAAAALSPQQRRELAFCEAGVAGDLARNGLDEAARERLAADALALDPRALTARYDFLSEWAAGALSSSLRASGGVGAAARARTGGD